MATNTYVALDKVTVGTATTTVTFTGISQSYTDLRIVINGGIDTADNNTFLRVGNGSIDSGSNYSDTFIDSRGTSTPGSSRHTNATRIQLDYYGSISTTNSTLTVDLMNYSNTTTYKTLLSRFGNTTSTSYSGTGVLAGLWRSTNAINTIQFSLDSTAKFNAGTTFSLYGIRAEGVSPTTKATGGAVYSDANYYYHVFGASGTFTPTQSISADILVVAGGGAGGGQNAGGGGAGGLLSFTSQSLTATNYTCTIGAGGTGSYPGGATSGANSQFGSLTASVGGGFGGCFTGGLTQLAASGGSGGGAHGDGGNVRSGGAGTSGQGFAGGSNSSITYAGGGGGGAGAVGSNVGGLEIGGNGGIGATSSLINAIGAITSLGQLSNGNYYLAGGGGGAGNVTQGVGGIGGGGDGSGVANTGIAISGTANTGGGGGATRGGQRGGHGGSGIVIVRYAKV